LAHEEVDLMDAPHSDDRGYAKGYADGLADMARVILNEPVAKAARLVDADALATEFGAAIAEGETRAFGWPVSKR
jgi:hypothetical protein